jgi:TolB protein
MRAALAIAAVALVVVLPAGGSTPSARILFDEPHGSSFDLVEIDADATNYLDLTPGDQTFYAGDQDGSWSPDGSRIVFTSHRDSNVSTEIYVMDADGSNQRRLTNDGPNGPQNSSAEIFDYDPAWSPLGGTIAYLKSVRAVVDVWLMYPDGSGQRALTSDGGEKFDLQWAPVGGRILFSRRDGTYAVSAGGGQPVRLVPAPAAVLSPDGARLAYGNQDGLWTAGPDGQNPARVSALYTIGPVWAPDGSTLAFVGISVFPELSTPKFGAPARQDLYTIGADGGRLRRLTGPPGEEYSTLPTGFAPSWWPDGSRLFYLSQRPYGSSGATTYVMNRDGSCEGAVAGAAAPLRRPLWRPGSQPGLGPIRCADLRVTLDLSGGAIGPAALGEAHEFRFTIDNDGSETATGLRVEARSDAPQVAILDGSAGAYPCSGPPRDLVCSLPELAPGSTSSVAFLVRSRRPGSSRSPSRPPRSSPTPTRARTRSKRRSRYSPATRSGPTATTFSTALRGATGSVLCRAPTGSTAGAATITSTRATGQTLSPAGPGRTRSSPRAATTRSTPATARRTGSTAAPSGTSRSSTGSTW